MRMEKLTDNMIRFAENKLGSTEYAGWCLAFIEDALEISNHIEIYSLRRSISAKAMEALVTKK